MATRLTEGIFIASAVVKVKPAILGGFLSKRLAQRCLHDGEQPALNTITASQRLHLQACHATVAAIWLNQDESHTQDYCSSSAIDHMHKVNRH